MSWDDVQDFLQKLNGRHMMDITYRLPTEAEWEYAAGAGAADPFAGPGLESMAWYDVTGAIPVLPLTESKGETDPVGTKKPNALGLTCSGMCPNGCRVGIARPAIRSAPTKTPQVLRPLNFLQAIYE